MDGIPETSRARRLLSKSVQLWSVYDFLAGTVAGAAGILFSPWQGAQALADNWGSCLAYGALVFLMARLLDVPSSSRGKSPGVYELGIFCLMSAVLAYVLLGGYLLFASYELIGRYIIAITVLTGAVLIFIPRLLLLRVLPRTPAGVVMAAGSRYAQTLPILYERLIDPSNGFAPVGLWCPSIEPEPNATTSPTADTVPLPESILNLPTFAWSNPEEAAAGLEALGARLVIICADDTQPLDPARQEAVTRLPLLGVQSLNYGSFMETYFQELPVKYRSFAWQTSFFAFSASAQAFTLKRLMDIAVSLFGLCCTLPFYPLIALIIRLDSPGSVFFGQKRVGYLGRIYTIYKFRTMRMDAEKDGARWATQNDSRVTAVGRFMRKTRLDEIPQLWNVLKGEMSLVGPRPERPEFVRDLIREIPLYERRHLVPPGLTGWAQICYRYGASKEDALRKLEFDLYYVKRLSLLFDLKIMLKTLPMIARGSR